MKSGLMTAWTVFIALAATDGFAQTVPFTFSPGTPAQSAQVNANFASLSSQIAGLSSRLAALSLQIAGLSSAIANRPLVPVVNAGSFKGTLVSPSLIDTSTFNAALAAMSSTGFIVPLDGAGDLVYPNIGVFSGTDCGGTAYIPAPGTIGEFEGTQGVLFNTPLGPYYAYGAVQIVSIQSTLSSATCTNIQSTDSDGNTVTSIPEAVLAIAPNNATVTGVISIPTPPLQISLN